MAAISNAFRAYDLDPQVCDGPVVPIEICGEAVELIISTRLQRETLYLAKVCSQSRLELCPVSRTVRIEALQGGRNHTRTIQTAMPGAELQEFVQVYAQREIECAGAGFSQPNTSALEQGIAFQFDGQTSCSTIMAQADLHQRFMSLGD